MTPLISCIMPVWNGERFIGEAVASIVAQTHRPIEIIVVDDGSTDNTEAAAKAACDTLTFLRQEHAGAAKARNLGLQHATGDFIALLDADDRWMPDKLALQLEALHADATLDCVLCRVRLFWEGLEAEAAAYRRDNRVESSGLPNSAMLARRTAFDAIGMFDASLTHASSVAWFSLFEARGLQSRELPEVLVERRMHAQNFSRQSGIGRNDEFLHLVKRTMDAKRGRPPAS